MLWLQEMSEVFSGTVANADNPSTVIAQLLLQFYNEYYGNRGCGVFKEGIQN